MLPYFKHWEFVLSPVKKLVDQNGFTRKIWYPLAICSSPSPSPSVTHENDLCQLHSFNSKPDHANCHRSVTVIISALRCTSKTHPFQWAMTSVIARAARKGPQIQVSNCPAGKRVIGLHNFKKCQLFSGILMAKQTSAYLLGVTVRSKHYLKISYPWTK